MKSKSDDILPRTIRGASKRGRERLVSAEEALEEAFAAVKSYVRDHPWIAVAGAAVIGGAVSALAERKQMPGPVKNVKIANKWINDSYARLPTQRQIRNMAKSVGWPEFLEKLKNG